MLHCTFTIYRPRVYSIIEWWSQQKGTGLQLLQAINVLKRQFRDKWFTTSFCRRNLWIRSQLSVVMPFTKFFFLIYGICLKDLLTSWPEVLNLSWCLTHEVTKQQLVKCYLPAWIASFSVKEHFSMLTCLNFPIKLRALSFSLNVHPRIEDFHIDVLNASGGSRGRTVSQFFPPANEVAERLCFYRCLRFCSQGVCVWGGGCWWYPSMPCSR